MKNSEIRELSTPELLEKIGEENVVLTRMKINHTISPLDNPVQLREQRRTIARLLTEKTRRELNKED